MGILKIGVVGCGRIGKLHINNLINSVPGVQVVAAADPMLDKSGAREWLAERKITNVSTDFMDVINNPEVDVVFVCSSTDTHCDVSMAAVQAGKHVFCEKPIDYDLEKVHAAINAAKEAGVKLQIGFCRRFDHNHRSVYDMVRDGKVGKVNIIKISSRDPEPPPVSYVKVSGGIFYDMMIHDFDMARFLAGSEVTEVNAIGSVLVDPGIGEAGDVDTALVTLKFANGAIGVIDNSRKAVYGYDQRVEVFGSEGCAEDQNDTPNTAVLSTADGAVHGVAYKVMWDRYTGAFVAEMQAFADAVVNDKETPVTGEDGLYPVLMAAAATKSLHEGRPVKISEIEA